MKELEVAIKLRNNRLKERRLALGLSQVKLAKKLHINAGTYGILENLRSSPFQKRNGEWTSTVVKLAAFYKVEPAELFPEIIWGIERSSATKKVDAGDLYLTTSQHTLKLLEPASASTDTERRELKETIMRVLSTLGSRERAILTMRYGLDGNAYTLEEVAEQVGVTRERIRQIEAKAFRKLRHPSRSKCLYELATGEAWEERQARLEREDAEKQAQLEREKSAGHARFEKWLEWCAEKE